MEDLTSQDEPAEIDSALYRALSDANRLFATSTDLPVLDTLASLSQLLVDHLDLVLVWISVLPEGEDWIRPLTAAGAAKEYPDNIRITARDDVAEGKGPIGLALRTGRVFRIDVFDKQFVPWQVRAREYGLGGGIAVPFRFHNGDRGIVSLYRREGKSFTPHIESLLVRLGEDLTVFLRRRREREELGRFVKYQESIGMLLHKLLGVPEPEKAFSDVIEILVKNTDAMGAWISVPTEEGYLKTVAAKCKEDMPSLENDIWGFHAPLEDDGSLLSHSTAAKAYRSLQPAVIDETSSPDLRVLKDSIESLREVRVAGAWPVMVDDRPYAILVIVSGEPDYFSSPLMSLIGQLIDGIRIAIQNYGSQSEARQISMLHKALLTEGDLLFTARREQDFLDGTCVRLIESGVFATVWIGMAHDESSVKKVASAGVNVEDLDLIPVIMASNPNVRSASVRAMSLNQTLYVPDYINSPINYAWKDLSRRNRWSSVVCIPIDRGGKVWGVMSVLSERIDGFSDEMIDLLNQVSQIISHGLDEIDLRAELNAERDRQSWLASHDVLTGLPNRRGLEDHLVDAIKRSRQNETILAVGMMDLDDFKALNDRYGHESGDSILRYISSQLSECLRDTDHLARVGGDEFVVVIEDVRKFSDLPRVLRKIQDVLTTPFSLPNGERIAVGGSLGLSLYAGDDMRPEVLLRQADQALYRLKGKKGYRTADWAFYAPGDPEGISVYPHVTLCGAGTSSDNLYQTLLRNDGLNVYYQPVVDLSTGRVAGIEALARLESPGMEVHPPLEFLGELSLADQRYLAIKVLDRAVSDLERLEKEGFSLWCSTSVLPELLVSEPFLEDLTSLLRRREVRPSLITLQVLEGSNFLSMDDAWRRLISLKELGVDLAIDDIGSAYASLLRLRDLPIDKMKLDQEFVRTLAIQPAGFHFLNAMSDLARGLEVDFIAEGAETAEILDALATVEVPFAQGFAISRPLPIDELTPWLRGYSLDASVEHPATMLGLYAYHVRVTSIYHQRLNAGMATPSAQACPLQRHVERLGYGGSDIDVAHKSYHEMLARYERAQNIKPNPELRSVEESREVLRSAILARLAAEVKYEGSTSEG